MTFRIDAHGLPIWDNGTLHVDLPNEVTYVDGDAKLKGYELVSFTMVDMIHLITLHLDEEALPWE